MKKVALKQLEKINKNQIENIFKDKESKRFNSILVDFESIERIDVKYLSVKCNIAERDLKYITFPVFQDIHKFIDKLKSNNNKKDYLSDNIMSLIEENNFTEDTIVNQQLSNVYDFPLEVLNNKVISEQRKYYFPETVKIDTCRECSGYKYVTCKNPECHGSHYINCQECSGIGKVVCDDCGGAGDVSCERCNGAGEVKCGSGAGQTAWRLLSSKNVLSGCNGSGYLGNKGQEYRCTICGGRGFVSCKECGSRGLVPCKTCRRSGEVSCSNCGASGKVECPDCYGDSQRFGKIDCPLCETAGLMGSFTYVETEIINKNYSAFIDLEKLPIKENDISMHLTDEIYEKYYLFNNSIQININDEIISEYITDFEVKEEIYRDKYPLIIEEDVFYQIIPCIKLNYRFVHTNKIHELVIIDIWNNPKVIFPENPEKLEISLNSAKKSFKGIFGKIFNTNDNKNKIDRINHCKFLIISELKNKGFVSNRIKEYLIEYISVIVDLNNSDIKELIKLCKEEKVEDIEKLKFNDDEFRKRAIEILKN